jgi:ABC-type hemin transport system ATPase subunit
MIEAHGLTKRYNGAAVVSGLSFTIRPGQVTSFLGPNGAGKSTTILTGGVGDYGPAVTVLPDGAVDPSRSSELELKLSRGSFRLSIAKLDADPFQAQLLLIEGTGYLS